MTGTKSLLADRERSIGELCIAGDWACMHGDLAALGDVVRRLAEQTPEPLHCEVVALGEACRVAPDRATAAWGQIKQLVQAGPP